MEHACLEIAHSLLFCRIPDYIRVRTRHTDRLNSTPARMNDKVNGLVRTNEMPTM